MWNTIQKSTDQLSLCTVSTLSVSLTSQSRECSVGVKSLRQFTIHFILRKFCSLALGNLYMLQPCSDWFLQFIAEHPIIPKPIFLI